MISKHFPFLLLLWFLDCFCTCNLQAKVHGSQSRGECCRVLDFILFLLIQFSPHSQHVTSPKPVHCKLNPFLSHWSISLGGPCLSTPVNPQRDKHFLPVICCFLQSNSSPISQAGANRSCALLVVSWIICNDKMESYYLQMTEKSWSIEQNLLGMLVNYSHCEHESLNSLLSRREQNNIPSLPSPPQLPTSSLSFLSYPVFSRSHASFLLDFPSPPLYCCLIFVTNQLINAWGGNEDLIHARQALY